MITIGSVAREEIEAAAARTRHVIRHTPITLIEPGAFPGTVMLKLEQLQHAGTVTVRGLFNLIVYALEQRSFDADAGLVSFGDDGVRVAAEHVARALDLPLHFAEDRSAACAYGLATGALLCDPESPEAITGLGTVGLELWTQTLGRLDTVIVSAGPLAVGIEAALGGQARVLLASATPDRAAYARRTLWRERRLAVDEATAVAYAYLQDSYLMRPDEHVALVLAGALTDPSDLIGLVGLLPR
ncbi:PALP domain-containing protein [Hamadaea tsunoensis]|uniref:hypothetical protein n=1 Tax=Hamadaea tsunoensis TaxID=53368 RepID=UPI000412FE74|nr:hypothetical protein [Hamadaea tsunoensis]